MGRQHFEIAGSQNAAAVAATILGLTGGANIRPEIYDFSFGCKDAGANNALFFDLCFYTAAGESTAVTPRNLDGNSTVASGCSAGQNHTTEPTYPAGSERWSLAVNQYIPWRWVASPGGEIVLPAVASNGAGLRVLHASATPEVHAVIHYRE